MRLILFATELEAKKTLAHSRRLDTHLFQFREDLVVISGMGPHAALHAVQKYAALVDEIWNVGIAGALHPDLTLGSVIPIRSVQQKDQTSLICANEGFRLYTSERPIHQVDLRQKLAKNWDLVDMEGYSVVHVALSLGKKVRLLKIVSDFASEGGSQLIHERMEEWSNQLFEIL